MANKRFTSIPNDYEITLNADAEVYSRVCACCVARPDAVVCLCQVNYVGDDAGISSQKFNFIPINDIANHDNFANVDVIAVVKNVDEMRSLVSKKTNKPLTKREITLVDDSNAAVT